MTYIEKLVAVLESHNLQPKIWEAHGKLRVYISPNLGKDFAKRGKAYFDYSEEDQVLTAKVNYDGGRVTEGTVFKCWHPKPTTSKWAWNHMRDFINNNIV